MRRFTTRGLCHPPALLLSILQRLFLKSRSTSWTELTTFRGTFLNQPRPPTRTDARLHQEGSQQEPGGTSCRSYQLKELLLQAALLLLQGLELLLLALHIHAQLADLSRPTGQRQSDQSHGREEEEGVVPRSLRPPTFFSWAWAWAFRLLICCWDRDAASSFCWEARSLSCRSATSRSSSMIRERSDTVAT